ncbi:hypothetical protein ACIQW7_16795 [Peribacillus simplex]|uniref:hypothetical protein n=1 Tax=Peribacillus TaxID=2675229 RepID=UPI00315A94E4
MKKTKKKVLVLNKIQFATTIDSNTPFGPASETRHQGSKEKWLIGCMLPIRICRRK